MIVAAGPLDAVSFTDGTSLDLSRDPKRTAGSKVSIHCQAVRDRPLDWFYNLLRRAPVKSGELKSKDVTDTFIALPLLERRKVHATLKHVRVNITDTRPYQTDVEAMLASILPGVDAAEFLRRLGQAEKRVAEEVRRRTRKFAASRMLWDSPAERLRLRHRALTCLPPWLELENGLERPTADLEDFDLTPFEGGKGLTNLASVSTFISKSGSAFFPAIDALDRSLEHLQLPATARDFWGVKRTLSDFHVFDEGNKKAIEWVDGRRNEALSWVDPWSQIRLGARPRPFEGVESKDSYFVQAADFAAGIVTALWERETLVEVVRSFESVTYNGKRVGEIEAAAITANLHRARQN